MAKRIAINGFGRIGRVAFRILRQRAKMGQTGLQVAAINDLTNIDTLAHLLKYDSVHGRFDAEVKVDGQSLVVDGQQIHISSERDPKNLPWARREIDVVLEATGIFSDPAKARMHIEAGAKKVLISAPTKGTKPDATICYGVNHDVFTKDMQIISTASCTTNCIVPVAKILNDAFGIESAMVTTVHSYTNDQRILDLPHSDLRRARAAAVSMIPTSTGAAKAVALVLPELEGKFDGIAIRVPTPNVSCVDLVATLSKKTDASEINAKLKAASEGVFKGVMGFTDEPLVSIDMNGTNESSIVDGGVTKVLGGKMVKILAWYDNEWGFTNRAVDLLKLLAEAS